MSILRTVLAACTACVFTLAAMQEPEQAKQRAVWKFVTVFDEMYFDWTDRDFDNLAKTFAEHGVTHAMTFNSTHYLWNFYRDFDRMADTVGRLCRAFHKYGIVVVEHHSSTIMYARLPEEPPLANRYWPHYEQDSHLDSDCHGVPVGSLFQVSGRSGKPLFTELYHNYGTCLNNPDFRRIYFGYLAKLYQAGIDGILPDDLWFMSDDACACEHCRRLFHERTGLTLPPPEKWNEAMADRDSELFLAWEHFRYLSIIDFEHALGDACKKLGYTQLRPHYCAAGVSWKHCVPVTLDDYRDLDWSFQEAFGGALRYSWPEYTVEAHHRTMVGRWHHAPPMTLSYPATQRQREFAWMFCLYTGHLYFPDDRDNKTFPEQPMRDFEKLHAGELAGYSAFARIAVYDSSQNRQLDQKYSTISGSLAQTMILENVPFNYVGKPDFDLDLMNRYELLIVPETRFLHDEEIAAIRGFAGSGKKVFWLGEAGLRTYEHYGRRTQEELAKLLGGSPNIVRLPPETLSNRPLPRVMAWNRDLVPPGDWQPPTAEEIEKRGRIARRLTGELTGPADIAATAPRGVLISSLLNPQTGGWTAHILNAAGSLDGPANPDGYRMTDEFPCPETGEFTVTLRKPDARKVEKVSAGSLYGKTVELAFTDNGDTLTFTVPSETLKTHLTVSIR